MIEKNFKPGWKFSEYELKGVPIRLAVGPKDLKNNSIEIARRDSLTKEIVKENQIENILEELLIEIQNNLFIKAKDFRDKNTTEVDNYDDFKNII